LIHHALDVLRKDVEAFGRDDHFLLAAADEELAVRTDLSDVAGVEPAVFERLGSLFSGVEVAARHVLAAHENLAVLGDLHFDAGAGATRRTCSRSTSRIFGTDTTTEMRRCFTCATMSTGLYPRMKMTTPPSIGGTNVAIDCPNMWLSGRRFRKRIGENGLAHF